MYLSKYFTILDWNRKIGLALDITNGLHYLHKENILHRDLHSRNIVIHQGKAKITDFGNSKSMNTITSIHYSLFGNIPYVAPEILKACKTERDPYTDIYSLGVILWEISSGKPPFEGSCDYAICTTILIGDRKKKSTRYNSKCWDVKPKKRHDIEDFYEKLE
ncbi:12764_t:CDS:2, partial [Funneliformis mosseae]